MLTRFLGTFEKYEPAPYDVFICSYFKSGTNWIMQIAYRGAAQFAHIHDLVPWPDIAARAPAAANELPSAT